MPSQDEGSSKWSIKKTAETVREGPSVDLWLKHLEGTRPLGIVPVNESGTAIFASLDIDDYALNAQLLVTRIENDKLPLVPVLSKSGGMHLFLFARNPRPAAEFVSILRGIAARLGYGKAEIFPKQTEILRDRGDTGSWMVMPYCPNTFGGRLQQQTGIRRTGGAIELREWLDLAERARLTDQQFGELMRKRVSVGGGGSHSNRGNGKMEHAADFEDGPPCLEHMAKNGFPGGQHNTALMAIGVYHKKVGEDWRDRVRDANARYALNQTEEEVTSLIRSLAKNDYYYKCKDEPLCSHCDSTICRSRPFGVGDGNQIPNITGLVMLNSLPDPLWFVDVNGVRLTCDNDQFFDYKKFNRLLQTKQIVCDPMKEQDWAHLRRTAMQSVNTVDPPPDASETVRFADLISEWITERTGSSKEDIQTGLSWHDAEGETFEDKRPRYFFRLRDLFVHLQKLGIKDVGVNKLGIIIEKEFSGGDFMFNFATAGQRKKPCRTRWVFEDEIGPQAVIPPARPPREVL